MQLPIRVTVRPPSPLKVGLITMTLVVIIAALGLVSLSHPVQQAEASATTKNAGSSASNAPGDPGPTLIEPPFDAQLSGLGTTLKWANPAGTTWFHVQVTPYLNDGPGINLVVGDSYKVSTAQYLIQEPDLGGSEPNYLMLPGMTYTWRVRTATVRATPQDVDWTEWSTRRFMTAPKTGASISPVSPAKDGVVAGVQPTLAWSNTDRTVYYYEVQVSKDSGFGAAPGSPFLYWELVHGGVSTPLNSYTIPGLYRLQTNTAYYWRVRPRVQGDGTPAPWCATWRFSTP